MYPEPSHPSNAAPARPAVPPIPVPPQQCADTQPRGGAQNAKKVWPCIPSLELSTCQLQGEGGEEDEKLTASDAAALRGLQGPESSVFLYPNESQDEAHTRKAGAGIGEKGRSLTLLLLQERARQFEAEQAALIAREKKRMTSGTDAVLAHNYARDFWHREHNNGGGCGESERNRRPQCVQFEDIFSNQRQISTNITPPYRNALYECTDSQHPLPRHEASPLLPADEEVDRTDIPCAARYGRETLNVGSPVGCENAHPAYRGFPANPASQVDALLVRCFLCLR
jgi:hypothetical protein